MDRGKDARGQPEADRHEGREDHQQQARPDAGRHLIPDGATRADGVAQVAVRQAGEGWSKIARDLGYKTLGSVIRSVKATERDVTRLAAERGQKPERMGEMEKPGKRR